MPTTTRTKSQKSLEDLYFDELADVYDVEKRLVRALPKMAKAACSEQLREAIEGHLEETQGHVEILEQVFQDANKTPRGKKCEAMVGLLEEGDTIMEEFKGSPAGCGDYFGCAESRTLRGIASYGCLQEWAQLMGEDSAAARFEEILEQEKSADDKLTEIARQVANQEAETGESEDDEEESPRRSTQSKSRNSGGSSRSTQSKSRSNGGSSRRKSARASER